MLEVRGVSKDFKNFKLENINFSLEEGFIMGLIGPNGSGKTTLIKMIMGLIEVDGGSISIFNKDINTNPIDIKNDIGFVYDNLDFYDHLKVKDFKKINSMFYKNFDEVKFDKCIDRFDISQKSYIKNLSKGQGTKLMLANAISHNAKLLILDEPTAGLDPIIRKELLSYLQEFIEEGKTSVIISTHNTDELDRIADYITFINKVNHVFTIDKENLREKYKIIKGSKEEISSMNTNVIGKKHMKYYSEALVKIDSNLRDYEELKNLQTDKIKSPNIEELMYYYVEGDR
ncbi:MAG: ABC transporter ATP-binding protein [Peptostreptococcaceae bacterium]